MQRFKADLHIHSVLSPCGSLEMSPENIVKSAIKAGLDIIALTDHNSTRQVSVIKKLGKENGLFVIGGVEVNTAEEIHCLALFETDDQLSEFQNFLDSHLIKVENNPEYFGYQLAVDELENVIYEEPWLLINALDAHIFEVEQMIHSLNGLFIPAHIDRPFNGIISQLGFVPENLTCDAFELSIRAKIPDWENNTSVPVNHLFIRNSDAHRPEDIGNQSSFFDMKEISFEEIRKMLHQEGGRKVIIL
jgi:3',5'-nucleoside bisphosphate phosphatase